jgi:hypothetical protein
MNQGTRGTAAPKRIKDGDSSYLLQTCSVSENEKTVLLNTGSRFNLTVG